MKGSSEVRKGVRGILERASGVNTTPLLHNHDKVSSESLRSTSVALFRTKLLFDRPSKGY